MPCFFAPLTVMAYPCMSGRVFNFICLYGLLFILFFWLHCLARQDNHTDAFVMCNSAMLAVPSALWVKATSHLSPAVIQLLIVTRKSPSPTWSHSRQRYDHPRLSICITVYGSIEHTLCLSSLPSCSSTSFTRYAAYRLCLGSHNTLLQNSMMICR